MVASSAFRELSEVLAGLESAGADVRHAAVEQEFAGAGTDEGESENVTANLTVDLPLLADVDTGERVSVAADTATVDGDALAVDLTVTVSAGDEGRTDAPAGTSDDPDFDTSARTRTPPAYKDPDALRAVYERYETFPEMTDALDVDVTSETVRRHMVKHDIHDPTDSTPTPHSATATRGSSVSPAEADDESETTADDGASVDAEAGDDPTAGRATSAREQPTNASTPDDTADGTTRSAVPDGGSATVGASTADGVPLTTTTVREVLADVSTRSGDGSTGAADPDLDLDLPETLTVAELADGIDRSRTIHELTRDIGVSRETARRLLQRYNLVHFVSRSMAAEQVTVSPDLVVRRLTAASR